MNILIIFLLIITIILLLFLLIKNNNSKVKDQQIDSLKTDLSNSLNIISKNINQTLTNQNMESDNLFKNVTDSLDKKIVNQNIEQSTHFLNAITSLDQKLAKQSETSNEQVKEIISRVSKLDSLNNHMEGLNENILSLESILSDKKARGTFGEIRLSQIFKSIFGENNTNIYEEQFGFSNGTRVDFVVHAPYPLGDIAIDSKFPLENYLKIIDSNSDESLNINKRNFKKDLKKHIDDINNKYIIEGETANQAIMFIPAEAIFSEIHAYHEDIINYGYSKKVWIASPTTLMATLNLLLVVIKDVKRNESTKQIHEELQNLKIEFDRYLLRWESLSKHMYTIYKDIKEVDVTSKKIAKKFENIEKAEF